MQVLTRPPIARMRPVVASGQTLDYSIRERATMRAGRRPGRVQRHDIIAVFTARKGGLVTTQTVRLHRWDEIALEKVTEMISRKIVTGEREMVAQVYLKKGALVPRHSHESEQMTYVLQGALKFLINGEEITVREGEVLHIPSWIEHQAEALDDTFELDLFSPIRQDWLDHTDSYFHNQ
jgi:unsaturated pyranuronate lyase